MVAMYKAGAKLACNIAWGRYAGFAKRDQKGRDTDSLSHWVGYCRARGAAFKVRGPGGGGLDGLLIYRKLIVVANIKFICYVGKANLSVLSLRLIELSR